MSGMIGTIIVGIIIISVGLLIWKKKMLFLLAGFRSDEFYGNPEVFAKRMGLLAILMGFITVLLPFFILVFGGIAKKVYEVLMIILVVGALVVGNYWRFKF
jgi:hypothetical protein